MFRISNIDIARISEGLKSGRGGIYNYDNYTFSTVRRPDFLNRMVLFVAKCIKDGTYDAFELNNNKFITDERAKQAEETTYDFEAMKNEFKELTVKIQHSVSKDEFKKSWAPKIIEITDKYLGVGKKVNDCTAKQAEQLSLILDDLKDLLSNGIDVA